jgi:plasmid stabilization system protein ParE
LERCRRFLQGSSPRAASKAAEAIERQLIILETNPEIGRPFLETSDLRELLIAFGESGYAALYRYLAAEDAVIVLAFRHQKESGY